MPKKTVDLQKSLLKRNVALASQNRISKDGFCVKAKFKCAADTAVADRRFFDKTRFAHCVQCCA